MGSGGTFKLTFLSPAANFCAPLSNSGTIMDIRSAPFSGVAGQGDLPVRGCFDCDRFCPVCNHTQVRKRACAQRVVEANKHLHLISFPLNDFFPASGRGCVALSTQAFPLVSHKNWSLGPHVPPTRRFSTEGCTCPMAWSFPTQKAYLVITVVSFVRVALAARRVLTTRAESAGARWSATWNFDIC